MTSRPRARPCSTMYRKYSLSSGAPPVMSKVLTVGLFFIICHATETQSKVGTNVSCCLEAWGPSRNGMPWHQDDNSRVPSKKERRNSNVRDCYTVVAAKKIGSWRSVTFPPHLPKMQKKTYLDAPLCHLLAHHLLSLRGRLYVAMAAGLLRSQRG